MRHVELACFLENRPEDLRVPAAGRENFNHRHVDFEPEEIEYLRGLTVPVARTFFRGSNLALHRLRYGPLQFVGRVAGLGECGGRGQ